MAALIDAIDIKRKKFFEFENTPYLCLEAVVNTPTARGGPDAGASEDAQPAHQRGVRKIVQGE